MATAADLNNNGVPEIFFQCHAPENLLVHEYDPGSGSYELIASLPVPINLYDLPMVIDDMEAGDVNHDGVADVVFCGNTGSAHVLTFKDGAYGVEYSSPPPFEQSAFSQTCSVGDVTHDGEADILVVNDEGAKVFSFDGTDYQEIWVGEFPIATPGIGASFIGDADNDGSGEFLFTAPYDPNNRLYESEVSNPTEFMNTVSFAPLVSGSATIIIGNLNPTNDTAPIDCDDSDTTQGAFEICGDGADNDCDSVADEGCPTEFCGDNYCAGEAAGEMCTTCPDDCGCFGPNCKHGCCGDGGCGKLENATNCPIDCS